MAVNLTEKVLVILPGLYPFFYGFFLFLFFFSYSVLWNCQISASLWIQLVYHPPLCFIHQFFFFFFFSGWWLAIILHLLWNAVIVFALDTVTIYLWFKDCCFWKWQLRQIKVNMVSPESAHYQTLVLCNWMSWISKDQYARGLCPYTHTFNGFWAL